MVLSAEPWVEMLVKHCLIIATRFERFTKSAFGDAERWLHSTNRRTLLIGEALNDKLEAVLAIHLRSPTVCRGSLAHDAFLVNQALVSLACPNGAVSD